MQDNVKKILLFGAAGAGKDTQADLLVDRFGLKKLSMGEMLRAEAVSGSRVGKEIAPYLERGEIVPNEIGTRLMRERVLEPETQRSGYVISSFPRTLEGFKNYLTFDQPTALIILFVPDEIAVKRLIARKRHDDHEETIRTRLRLYHEFDEATIDWVKHNTTIPVHETDGALPIEQVHQNILNFI